MKELTCNCGFTVQNEDPSVVEVKMWHHTIKDHIDMLKSMTDCN